MLHTLSYHSSSHNHCFSRSGHRLAFSGTRDQSSVMQCDPRSLCVRYVPLRFRRAMLCERGLCCHAVYICLFVCLSRSYILSKRINTSIFKTFSPSGSRAFCFFLSRVSILTRDIHIANLSVCLSVCLSVRP